MTLLRRRMLEDLRVRNYSPRTTATYVAQVAAFARYHGRAPDRLGSDEVRKYLFHLLDERGAKPATVRVVAAALRFFYRISLRRGVRIPEIPYPRRDRQLPVVLSRDEVDRLLAAASTLRDRTLLLTAYATGLRVSELVSLRIADIDGSRRVIRVSHGKGAKDRFVPLFPVLHRALRDYYRQVRPQEWLFPSTKPGQPMSTDLAQKACHRARARAGLAKVVTPHTLRRCFATHLHENGVDLLSIKLLLGHSSLKTVQLYALISNHALNPQRVGMDLLRGLDAVTSPPAKPEP